MLDTIDHGEIAEIRMHRAPVNAMNTDLVVALDSAHKEAVAQGANAVVVSGMPGMFSGGLDVPELLPLGPEEILDFWNAFFRLMKHVAGSPVPVVAAITGHSPAGGAVLAIHCDYRVAASGSFKIGLNEVQVGLPVPHSI